MAEDGDTQTNEGDTKGKETPDNTETPKENISELDKLKASNLELEKELIKGRELKAEAQKLEAEKMMGGDTGASIKPKEKEETPKEYRDRIDKEIAEGKHAD
jgi:hypothetical protein